MNPNLIVADIKDKEEDEAVVSFGLEQAHLEELLFSNTWLMYNSRW